MGGADWPLEESWAISHAAPDESTYCTFEAGPINVIKTQHHLYLEMLTGNGNVSSSYQNTYQSPIFLL